MGPALKPGKLHPERWPRSSDKHLIMGENYAAKMKFLTGLPRTVQLKGYWGDNAVFVNGNHLSPDKSLRVRNHSPTGFAWGYLGSGPAQLSLAILLEFMSEERALEYYQQFKDSTIAPLPQSDFDYTLNLYVTILLIETANIETPTGDKPYKFLLDN